MAEVTYSGAIPYGDEPTRQASARFGGAIASTATLKDVPSARRRDGMVVLLKSNHSTWRFHSTSVLTGDDLLVVAPNAGSGRWIRLPGQTRLHLPFDFNTADAAILLTLQAGQVLNIREAYWDIVADLTGGSASAIGVSSSVKTNFTTKGALLGGASGDVAATLVAANTPVLGTIGSGFDTLAKRRVLWKAGDTIRFDRITSAFTAGSGRVALIADVLQNDGA